jgi:DNA polymerase III epsilon subunit family exonuclease
MKLAVVDIETTGMNREGQKITEVAIVCVDDGVITEEWSSLINPEIPIPWGITKLTGITDEMVSEAPKFYGVAKKIVELTESRVFVAHNAFFDYRFLQREFSDLGFTFQREVMCTVRLGRKAFPGLPSYSLHNLSRHFGLIRLAEHRALDDAKACYEIFRRAHEASPEAVESLDTRPLPPGLDDFSLENLPARPGTYFFYSKAGLLLYVGKARSIRDRVRQHFQTVGLSKKDLELRSHVARVEYKEWGSDLLASLMELQFIKTLRPLMNRASRKINFRYTLTLHPKSLPGEEVRVSTTVDEESPRYGSRERAKDARAKVYKDALGVEADGLFFTTQMEKFRAALGEAVVMERLREKMAPESMTLADRDLELPGRTKGERALVVIRQGGLKEVQIIDEHGEVEIHEIGDYPDMRRLVLSYLKK